MYKTEVYLREEQSRFLHDLSYLESRRRGRRVSIAQLIRDAVDILMRRKKETVHKETQVILSNTQLLEDIKHAQKELDSGKYSSSTKEVFGDN